MTARNQIAAMKSRIFLLFICIMALQESRAGTGDTTLVQTLRYDTTLRAGVFHFPDDSSKSYEKIIMRYSMRCKNGLVSTGTNRNLGCGEWDYNCYTYIVDSTQSDSLRIAQNSYLITNHNDTAFIYTTQPVYDYYQSSQIEVTPTLTITETVARPPYDTSSVCGVFSGNQSCAVSRSQFIWTAAELLAAGLSAGPLTGFELQIPVPGGGVLNNLRIQLKHTTQDSLTDYHPELTGLTQVYFLNTPFTAAGPKRFNFSTPFIWDGTSNLLVDLSWTLPAGASSNQCVSGSSSFAANGKPGISVSGEDGYLNLQANGNLIQPDSGFFSTITNEITVAFWSRGDSLIMPANSSIIYGKDYANNRQVNVHLPWSDSNVYWDCGGSNGAFDRINVAVNPSDYKGRWTFWAFTKNASTGEMNIYMDGQLLATGSGKTRIIDIRSLYVGGFPGWYQYYGDLDEVSLWNKALDTSSIRSIMYAGISSSHPDYANLKAYYKLDDASGTIAHDASATAADAMVLNPVWRRRGGHELFRNLTQQNARRPDVSFISGQYNYTTQIVSVTDSVMRNPVQLVDYSVVNNTLQAGDTNYVWPVGYSYTFDSTFATIDSLMIPPTDTAISTTLYYYQKRPMYLELINFITPYGIGLNLNGLNGRTWEFDVTDYAPVLRGNRYLAMGGSPYQEDNAIQFVFYEGTPTRPVKSISNIWPNGTWIYPSWSQIYTDNYYESRTVSLDPSASMYKIRSAISGHGQEGEFIPRNHTITLNGTTQFTRQVWKPCATNPIYPQGGTWIYDRAGWCPGAAVDMNEIELTPYVNPGQHVALDYSMPYIANPGSTNYRVNHQLVTYGAPSFSLDAAVAAIKSPSVRTEYMRFNPLCDDPVVIIKNTGADTLTSLTITYGRQGGTPSTFQWTGALPFLAEEEVVLPSPDWMTSAIDRFEVAVSSPNGQQDQYAANDSSSTDFTITDTYYGRIVVEYKPNNYPNENTYTITDANGTILLNRTASVAGFILRDTLNLPTGCYKLYMSDSGGDGLSFWANSNQGAGYLRFRAAQGSALLKSFQPDFGDNINYQFTINYSLPVETVAINKPEVTIFPNPSTGSFNLKVSGPRYSHLKLDVMDITGRKIFGDMVWMTQSEQDFLIDLPATAPGIYLLHVSGDGFSEVQRIEVH